MLWWATRWCEGCWRRCLWEGEEASLSSSLASPPGCPGSRFREAKGGAVFPQPSRHFLCSHLCYRPFMQQQSGFKGLGAAGTEV